MARLRLDEAGIKAEIENLGEWGFDDAEAVRHHLFTDDKLADFARGVLALIDADEMIHGAQVRAAAVVVEQIAMDIGQPVVSVGAAPLLTFALIGEVYADVDLEPILLNVGHAFVDDEEFEDTPEGHRRQLMAYVACLRRVADQVEALNSSA